MEELQRYQHRRAVSWRRLKGLGVNNIRCKCGETDPTCFDADHIGRRGYDPTVWGVCANCHRKITARQASEHPKVGLHPGNPFEKMGHSLLGMYEYLSFIAERLRDMAEIMFKLAGKGITLED